MTNLRKSEGVTPCNTMYINFYFERVILKGCKVGVTGCYTLSGACVPYPQMWPYDGIDLQAICARGRRKIRAAQRKNETSVSSVNYYSHKLSVE
jgi:hypothetical protein